MASQMEMPSIVNNEKIISYLEKYFINKLNKAKIIEEHEINRDNDTKYLDSAIDFIKDSYFDYQDWNKLGFALSCLGEEGRKHFFRLSYNKYWDTPDQRINEEYDNCLKNYNPIKSDLGTLFQFAINRGYKYPNNKNNFSKVFYEFKLCLLQFPEEGLLLKIVDYSIFREAIEQNNLFQKEDIIIFIKNRFNIELT